MELLPLVNQLLQKDMTMNVLFYPTLIFIVLYICSRFFVRLDKYRLKMKDIENCIKNLERQTTNRMNWTESQVEKIEAIVKEMAKNVNNQHRMINEHLENIRQEYKQINTRLSRMEGSQ